MNFREAHNGHIIRPTSLLPQALAAQQELINVYGVPADKATETAVSWVALSQPANSEVSTPKKSRNRIHGIRFAASPRFGDKPYTTRGKDTRPPRS